MSEYPKVEVPESCCKSTNKDLEKIKECIRQIRWSDAEFQYDEVIAAAERMAAAIEDAQKMALHWQNSYTQAEKQKHFWYEAHAQEVARGDKAEEEIERLSKAVECSGAILAVRTIEIDQRKTPEHTHYLLSDGTITPVKPFHDKAFGSTIVFALSKPLTADMEGGLIKVTLEKPYVNEELEIIGFIKERK